MEESVFTLDEHIRMLAALRTDLNRGLAQVETQMAELGAWAPDLDQVCRALDTARHGLALSITALNARLDAARGFQPR